MTCNLKRSQILMKKPTQNDVAKLAGVSRGTVSMVLNRKTNGRIPIGEETIKRVLEAAQALGYAPNPVAKMLKQGTNQLIGVFAYEPTFFTEIRTFQFPHRLGIEKAASEHGYDVLNFTRHRNNPTPKIFVNDMNSLLLADGTIILGSYPDRDELRRLVEEGYPFVYIGRREVPGCEINWVTYDYRRGSYLATQHLMELGHTSLGFVYNSWPMLNEPTQDKLLGVNDAIEANSNVNLITIDMQDGKLLDVMRANQISGLLVTDPTDVPIVLNLFLENNIAIPDDVSLVSLVDVDEYLPYPVDLTYVETDRYGVAELAVETLSRLLSRAVEPPQQHVIDCRFIVGSTTATPTTGWTRR